NIIVQLENEENVNISVRDVQGKEMFVLLSSSTLSAGKHTFALPNNLAPGTYIINIQSDKGSQNIKAIKIN
ncbi:MAG: T9SS type A sorting domain-containing protein, partial [Flavobacteriales bacterium]